MWRPLCLAALNTPPERASAQVFLNVLRDSLGARRASSDMLLPRLDLSALFPQAAAAFVERAAARCAPAPRSAPSHGATTAGRSTPAAAPSAAPAAPASTRWCWPRRPPPRALLAPLASRALAAQLTAFDYEPITTCYLQYAPALRLDLPFYALLDDPAPAHWGQFVFDRGQLDPGQAGLLAVVVSASGAAARARARTSWRAAIAAQLAAAFGRPELAAPQWTQVITEKRATFACTPGPGAARQRHRPARPGAGRRLHGQRLSGHAGNGGAQRRQAAASGAAVPGVAPVRRPDCRLPRQNCSLSHSAGSVAARIGTVAPSTQASSCGPPNEHSHSDSRAGPAGICCRKHSRDCQAGTDRRRTTRRAASCSRGPCTAPDGTLEQHGQTGISRRAEARHDRPAARNCRPRPWPITSSVSSTAWPPAAPRQTSRRNWTIRKRSP